MFVADLLMALRTREIAAELICWDSADGDGNVTLANLAKSDLMNNYYATLTGRSRAEVHA